MTSLWLLCLLGAVASGVPLTGKADSSPCQPGSVWTAEDGCNICSCTANGVVGCTFIGCSARNPDNTRNSGDADAMDILKPLPLSGTEDEKAKAYRTYGDADKPQPLPQPWDQELQNSASAKPDPKPVEERSGVNCTEGEQWQEDCNTCHCLGDGRAACTKVACFSEDRSLATSIRGLCEAGVTWSDDCNVCQCIDDTQVICSYRTCAGTESRRRRRQAGCTPGSVRRVDCNTCLCLPNGREACSKVFCLPKNSQSLGQSSGTGRAAEEGGVDDKCPQQCPADCASFPGENGCLRCRCDHGPFPGLMPVPVPDGQDSQPSSSRQYVNYGFELHKVPVAGADRWYGVDPVDPGFEAQPGWMLGGR